MSAPSHTSLQEHVEHLTREVNRRYSDKVLNTDPRNFDAIPTHEMQAMRTYAERWAERYRDRASLLNREMLRRLGD